MASRSELQRALWDRRAERAARFDHPPPPMTLQTLLKQPRPVLPAPVLRSSAGSLRGSSAGSLRGLVSGLLSTYAEDAEELLDEPVPRVDEVSVLALDARGREIVLGPATKSILLRPHRL